MKTCFNLLTIFLLSGLWHGAGWKFVVWGAVHDIYLIVARMGSTGMFSFSFFAGLGAGRFNFYVGNVCVDFLPRT